MVDEHVGHLQTQQPMLLRSPLRVGNRLRALRKGRLAWWWWRRDVAAPGGLATAGEDKACAGQNRDSESSRSELTGH